MARTPPPGATPSALGFSMPPEWAPHKATWLAWPHDPVTFPGRVGKVEDTYVEILRALSPHELVELVVKDDLQAERVRGRLADAKVGNVRLHLLGHVDVWARDWGPIFLVRAAGGRRELGATKWRFNAWGDKYEDLKRDDALGAKILAPFDIPVWTPGIVLEGGSIDVNGGGVLLTTEQCLLHPNRNPHLDRTRIELLLKDHLGVHTVLWLGDGVEGDDTDGHVDDIARFVARDAIVCAVEDDARDPNHGVLAANLARLERMRDPASRPFRIARLPMPGRIGDDEGRLPASYANFYVANRVVLAPAFGDENDAKAVRALEACFPDRRIVPIQCEDLVHGMGTLHCITQQQPATGPV